MGSIRNVIRTLCLPVVGTMFLSLCIHCGGGGGTDSPAPTPQVQTPPTITTQPQSQTITEGQPATFTVAASGTSPLSYQWKHDGASTGENASTLSIASVQTSDAGIYTVTVSSTAGDSATSDEATLTVDPAPPGTHSISGTVTGDGQQGVVITLSGPVNATLTPDSGTYSFTNLPDGDYFLTCSQRGFTYTPDAPMSKLRGADLTQDFDSYMGVGTTANLEGIWFSDASHGWAVGAQTILSWDGQTWISQSLPDTAPNADLMCVSGTGPEDVWAVGHSGVILHWDGLSWISKESGTSADIRCLWAAAPGDVWAGTTAGILHWDGQTWLPSPFSSDAIPSAILGIWASGSYAFAGDVSGSLYVWDGSIWSFNQTISTTSLYGFYVISNSNMWAVGEGGLVLHYTGQSADPVDASTTEVLRAVWGSNSIDVWAVGAAGTLRHWSGVSWSPAASDSPYDLLAVHGSNASNAWVAGSRTLMKLHQPGF